MEIRERVFKELVVVQKLGKKSAEENLKLAEEIGNVPQAGDPRWKTIIERPGVIKVTEGGLFGHKEKLDWHNSASYFDNYVFENEYPRTNGFIEVGETWGSAGSTLNATSIGDTFYKKSSTPQYVTIKGGPHGPATPAYASGSFYDKALNYKNKDQKSNIYDADIRQEQNLTIDGATGNTVEFWLKLPTEPSKSQSSAGHAYFDLWNDSLNYSPGSSLTYGRLLRYTGGNTTNTYHSFIEPKQTSCLQKLGMKTR